jgi:uncharacterized protein (DUF169 family)/predicted Fe-Mo cluster-binding NifX family protein
MMKVALPYWQGRISPVLDAACTILVVATEGTRVAGQEKRALDTADAFVRAQQIAQLGVDTLICGAVSEQLDAALQGEGVQVIANICGPADEVLAAFLSGSLPGSAFVMPGSHVPQPPPSKIARDCSSFGRLESATGSQWIGIRFLNSQPADRQQAFSMCEALSRSFEQSLSISCGELSCAGALRTLGHADIDEQLARHIAEASGSDLSHIRRILGQSPRMNRAVTALMMGRIEDAQLYVSYMQPEGAMRVLRLWQQCYGALLDQHLTGFMAVCGAVVAAHHKQSPAFSFGCPESRQRGRIAPGRMVAVLPSAGAADMLRTLNNCQRMNERRNHGYPE